MSQTEIQEQTDLENELTNDGHFNARHKGCSTAPGRIAIALCGALYRTRGWSPEIKPHDSCVKCRSLFLTAKCYVCGQ